MITALRPADARGHFDHGWLQTWHSFSFADYYDPVHMGFRSLRVINEDRIAPGQGFAEHPHRDMEILSYVIAGTIEHRDSMGNQQRVTAGEVQRMTAGTGVRHSEYNPDPERELHLLQIWILPQRRNLAPGYEQRDLLAAAAPGGLALVASPDGREGSMHIHQDLLLYAWRVEDGAEVYHRLAPSRAAWVQVIAGTAQVAGDDGVEYSLDSGDGLAIEQTATVHLRSAGACELLLFDLA